MSNEITGIIAKKMEKVVYPSGFEKQTLLVESTEGKYPQTFPIDFIKEKTDLLNQFSAGDKVTVSFNIRTREYNDRYYVDLAGWKISAVDSRSPATPPPSAKPAPPPQEDLGEIPF